MSANRARRRPRLALVEGSTAPAPPVEAPPETPAHYVMRSHGIGGAQRLVLLDGDPHAPFKDRRAVATLEYSYGSAPPAWVDEFVDGILEAFRQHGARVWDLERRTVVAVQRGHLELLP